MASANKTLGRFQLTGIPPAPRGVPQIEVTFDIDANGIVNVSAKDLGTGKSQNVVIQSSSNMNKDDIDKAVKEAERFAEEDKKKQEEIEVKNNADSTVYQTEKSLKDLGDKVSDDDKKSIEEKIAVLKNIMESSDIDAIKKATEELSEAFYPIAQKMYQQTDQAQAQGAQPGGEDYSQTNEGKDDNVVDADYEVVDDDKK
jgi:molecular chaperone DnaK